MLLDRDADVFLARRSGADGWLVKPLDAFSLRRAATAILDGEPVEPGSTRTPCDVDAAAAGDVIRLSGRVRGLMR